MNIKLLTFLKSRTFAVLILFLVLLFILLLSFYRRDRSNSVLSSIRDEPSIEEIQKPVQTVEMETEDMEERVPEVNEEDNQDYPSPTQELIAETSDDETAAREQASSDAGPAQAGDKARLPDFLNESTKAPAPGKKPVLYGKATVKDKKTPEKEDYRTKLEIAKKELEELKAQRDQARKDYEEAKRAYAQIRKEVDKRARGNKNIIMRIDAGEVQKTLMNQKKSDLQALEAQVNKLSSEVLNYQRLILEHN